jgi:hypothetical protein
MRRIIATGCPSFCSLLQLKDHVPAIIVISEELYIIDDQDQRTTRPAGILERNFLKFVQG